MDKIVRHLYKDFPKRKITNEKSLMKGVEVVGHVSAQHVVKNKEEFETFY